MSVPIGVIPSSDIRAAMAGVGNLYVATQQFFVNVVLVAPHGPTNRLTVTYNGVNVSIVGLSIQVSRGTPAGGVAEAYLQVQAPLAVLVAQAKICSGLAPENAIMVVPSLPAYPQAIGGGSQTLRVITDDSGPGGTVSYYCAGFFADSG